MGCTVSELLNRVSSAELNEWAAYAELEPFGAEWDNWRAGMLASTVANVNRGKHQKAYTAQQFMPGRKEKQKQQPADIMARFKLAFRGRNG